MSRLRFGPLWVIRVAACSSAIGAKQSCRRAATTLSAITRRPRSPCQEVDQGNLVELQFLSLITQRRCSFREFLPVTRRRSAISSLTNCPGYGARNRCGSYAIRSERPSEAPRCMMGSLKARFSPPMRRRAQCPATRPASNSVFAIRATSRDFDGVTASMMKT
jgi:hypothetical protein